MISTLLIGMSMGSATTLYVDPSSNSFSVGQTFDIQVKLADVIGLAAYDFKLGYNTSILDIVNVSMTPPSVWGSNYLVARNSVDEVAGVYWVAVAKLSAAPPFDGSATLATITFQVTGEGASSLDLYGTELVDFSAQFIPHDVSDGYFDTGCPGDVDGDGYVGSLDASRLAGAYGTSCGNPIYDSRADFNDDCYIGSADASILAGKYGMTC